MSLVKFCFLAVTEHPSHESVFIPLPLKGGVKIIHWRQSHTEDGASAYRLDWNGMCVAFTGDGRPNSLTAKYAKGCDLLITEVQVELIAISSREAAVHPC